MNVVSLFSGAGGLDLGFCLAGHKIIWANDFDNEAVNSYNTNIGKYMSHNAICADIVKMLDVSKNSINELIPDCDIVIGGFPCQGFTIANLERSMEDERNYLYLQLLKVISVKQPKYFLLENVKGLENIDGGKVLPMILDDLEYAGTKRSKFFSTSKGCGYSVYYNVFNALYFGVPENRERVIILGIRNDLKEQTQLNKFLSKENLRNKLDKRKILTIPYTHSKESKIEGFNPNGYVNKLYKSFKNKRACIVKYNNPKTTYRINTLRDAIMDLPDDYDVNILNHNGSKCKVNIKNRIGNRATYWDKPAPTIMGRGSGTGGPLIPPHPNRRRRFTVREVARIQTFPDDFEFKGSVSCCYRQIGNAVPVLMAYNIAKIFNS